MGEGSDARLDRAERDIQRLFNGQDRQTEEMSQLRRDLRDDLVRLETRLETKIEKSHDLMIAEVRQVEAHLEKQDEFWQEQLQRDDDDIEEGYREGDARLREQLFGPLSSRSIGIGIFIAVAAVLISHFGFGIG